MKLNRVKNLPDEEWRDIKNYELYAVSNKGRLKRNTYEKFYHRDKSLRFYPEMLMKQQKYGGYKLVTLIGGNGRKELRVNRLVAEAFIPNPNNLPIVNHLSEVKTDNRAENLKWASGKTNANWGTRNKRISENSKGRTFSQAHRDNLSKAMKGNKNRAGKKNSKKQLEATAKAKSKPVVARNMTFASVREAANHFGVKYRTFARWLTGERKMPQKYIELGLRYASK